MKHHTAISALLDAMSYIEAFDADDFGEDGRQERLLDGIGLAVDLLDPHRLVKDRIEQLLPGAHVEVSDWAGCDEHDWVDPVYVTGSDANGRELADAVCDLAADDLEAQALMLANDLVNG